MEGGGGKALLKRKKKGMLLICFQMGAKMIYMGVYFLFADMKELQIQNPLIYRIKKKRKEMLFSCKGISSFIFI